MRDSNCSRSASSRAKQPSKALLRSLLLDVVAACFSRLAASAISRPGPSMASAAHALPTGASAVAIRKRAGPGGTSPLANPTIQTRSVFHSSGLRSVKVAATLSECLACRTAAGSPPTSKLTSSSVSMLTEKSLTRLRRIAHSRAIRTWEREPTIEAPAPKVETLGEFIASCLLNAGDRRAIARCWKDRDRLGELRSVSLQLRGFPRHENKVRHALAGNDLVEFGRADEGRPDGTVQFADLDLLREQMERDALDLHTIVAVQAFDHVVAEHVAQSAVELGLGVDGQSHDLGASGLQQLAAQTEGRAQCVHIWTTGSRVVARQCHGGPSTGAPWKTACSAATSSVAVASSASAGNSFASLCDTLPPLSRTERMMRSMSVSGPSITCFAHSRARRRLRR